MLHCSEFNFLSGLYNHQGHHLCKHNSSFTSKSVIKSLKEILGVIEGAQNNILHITIEISVQERKQNALVSNKNMHNRSSFKSPLCTIVLLIATAI